MLAMFGGGALLATGRGYAATTFDKLVPWLDAHPDAHVRLVGLPDALRGFSHERATVVEASEVVGMDDPVEVGVAPPVLPPAAGAAAPQVGAGDGVGPSGWGAPGFY